MTILEMSAGGSLLIAVILLLRRAALFRLPKWSFLLLWAAALCRLLIPFSVPSQFSVYNGAAWFSQAAEQEEAPGGPFEPSGTVRAPAPPPQTTPGPLPPPPGRSAPPSPPWPPSIWRAAPYAGCSLPPPTGRDSAGSGGPARRHALSPPVAGGASHSPAGACQNLRGGPLPHGLRPAEAGDPAAGTHRLVR